MTTPNKRQLQDFAAKVQRSSDALARLELLALDGEELRRNPALKRALDALENAAKRASTPLDLSAPQAQHALELVTSALSGNVEESRSLLQNFLDVHNQRNENPGRNV